uniref:Uncharacterized protein n=1 Tax=Melanothamnus harveyi TaxID=397005 RepID=A0A1Z1MIA1_MELHR|nr:hypothetical protein [Melanothamnus harveyi]ARW65471.1 hypothetical protein [Melanothamnus harveyi]
MLIYRKKFKSTINKNTERSKQIVKAYIISKLIGSKNTIC